MNIQELLNTKSLYLAMETTGLNANDRVIGLALASAGEVVFSALFHDATPSADAALRLHGIQHTNMRSMRDDTLANSTPIYGIESYLAVIQALALSMAEKKTLVTFGASFAQKMLFQTMAGLSLDSDWLGDVFFFDLQQASGELMGVDNPKYTRFGDALSHYKVHGYDPNLKGLARLHNKALSGYALFEAVARVEAEDNRDDDPYGLGDIDHYDASLFMRGE